MSFLTAPLARLCALIEGSYPVTPVSGRSVTAGRLKPARLHGDLRDPEFPGVHYQRAYDLQVVSSGRAPGDPPNVRAGSMRAVVVVQLDIGYLTSRDAPSTGAGVGGTLYSPTLLAHSDHEDVAQCFAWPNFWTGTSPSIVRLIPDSDVETAQTEVQSRIVVSRRWRMTLSYAPGTAWS